MIGMMLKETHATINGTYATKGLSLRTKRGPNEDYKLVLHKYKRDASSIAIYWRATRFAQFVPHLLDFHRACASYSIGTCCLFLSFSLFLFLSFFFSFSFFFFSFSLALFCANNYTISLYEIAHTTVARNTTRYQCAKPKQS